MIVVLIIVAMVVIPSVTLAAMVQRAAIHHKYKYLSRVAYDSKMLELEEEQTLAIEAATSEAQLDAIEEDFKTRREAYKIRR